METPISASCYIYSFEFLRENSNVEEIRFEARKMLKALSIFLEKQKVKSEAAKAEAAAAKKAEEALLKSQLEGQLNQRQPRRRSKDP